MLKFFDTNYSDAAPEKEDNAACEDARGISEKLGLPINSAKGVLGSLVKKGLCFAWEGNGSNTSDCIGLTDEGIDAVFS